MDYSVQIEKICGKPDQNNACGVFTKRISLEGGNVGTFVCCFLINNPGEGDFSDLTGDIFDLAVKKLENAEDAILETLLLSRDSAVQYTDGKNLQASFLLTFFLEDACYVARHGDGVKLLVFDAPKSAEVSFESGSGPVKSGQLYLLATEKFISTFDTSDLAKNRDIDLGDVIDGIATEIVDLAHQSEIGAVFVHVEEVSKSPSVEESKGLEKEEVGIEEEEGEDEGGGTESTKSTESMEGEEEISVSVNRSGSDSVKNPLGGIFSALSTEFGRLRHGDIGAVLRLRKNVVVLGFLIFVILAGSVFYTLNQKSRREKSITIDSYILNASSKLSEGESLVELNKQRAREILVLADSQIKAALALDPKNQKAVDLASQITSKLKETEVTSNMTFETVVDVSNPLFGLSPSAKNLVGIADGKIFVINTADKKSTDVAGVSSPLRAAVFDNKQSFSSNKAFVVTGSNVVRVDLATEAQKAVINAGGAGDIGIFLGNIYLLYGNKIAKYVPIEGGYSGPTEYLNTPMNFGNKSRMAIDGSVWVTSGKQIYQFTRGEKQNFEISGLVSGSGDFGLIYTSSSLNNLYVVDTANSALLVISKDGVYKKAYQSPEFGKASGIVVSDDESKMYVAVGSKVLEAGL